MGRMVGNDLRTPNPKSSFQEKFQFQMGAWRGSFKDPKSKSKFSVKRPKFGEALVAFSYSNSKTLGLTEPNV